MLHLETWIGWLQRTTEEVKSAMEKLNMDDWVAIARQRQWSWACKVVHHAADRWTARILQWQPDQGCRQVGHPRRRWLDPIDRFAQSWSHTNDVNAWIHLLANKEEANATVQIFTVKQLHERRSSMNEPA